MSLSLARSLAAKSLTTIKTNQHISKNSQPTRGQQIKYKGEGRGDNPRRINIRRNSPNRGEPSSFYPPFCWFNLPLQNCGCQVAPCSCLRSWLLPPNRSHLDDTHISSRAARGGGEGIKDQFPAGCFCSAGFTCTVLGTG